MFYYAGGSYDDVSPVTLFLLFIGGAKAVLHADGLSADWTRRRSLGHEGDGRLIVATTTAVAAMANDTSISRKDAHHPGGIRGGIEPEIPIAAPIHSAHDLLIGQVSAAMQQLTARLPDNRRSRA